MMPLLSTESVEQRRDKKNYTRSRKKHKRLGVDENGKENDGEVRRSNRVERAPVLLDAPPKKKRRRVDNNDALSSVDKGKRLVREDEIVEDNCQLEKDTRPNQTRDHLENLEVEIGSLTEDIYKIEAEDVEDNREIEKRSHQTRQDESNDVELAKKGVKPMDNGISERFEKINIVLDGKVGSAHMKEGRHCGFCGGGTSGKPPPKKLLQDVNGSDKEESGYDLLDGFGKEPGWLGRLLGPINDRYGISGIWVHHQCVVWSPQVYFSGLGRLKNVTAELWRGRGLKCSRCGRPGATLGCRVTRCPRTYHLPCARATGSIFDHRKFLIACSDHRHLFQPHGIQYVRRLKKLKERNVNFDLRKTSNEAFRKDIEAEERFLENNGVDEEFLKRESKRLQRDMLRIAPTYIGGGNSDSQTQFHGWESIAGLHDVIQCMKEVVILPLIYPEFFTNLGMTPPRGVMLHGYPGTGKTLVVRALIGSCARGDKRIAYFVRKGADCLGKYAGDAERQLRLLFQVAEKSQPSIIFFDEIDGLAPCRSRHQDQTHSSVVSTLLALMDGLKSRGSVVVIGATNRPDAVDPALRRPGRFDREIYFPLPSASDREAILSLHTIKWPKPINGSLLKLVARKTVGFAGADLQALCTQAAMISLRRSFPLKELLSGAGEKALSSKLPLLSFTVEEKDWLDAISISPPPCSRRDAGNATNDVVSSPLAANLVPFMLQPLSELLVSLYLDEHVWLPPPLSKSAVVIRNVIISALNRKGQNSDSWWLTLCDLLQESETLHDIEDNLRRETILTEDNVCNYDSVLDVGDDEYLKYKPSKLQRVGPYPGSSHCFELGKKSGSRILIAGKPSSGQRHLASCLLQCFVGNVEMQKLDLATMSQEGRGDVIQGLTHILTRCSNLCPCVVFLPRMDLWAVETCYHTYEDQDNSPSPNCKKSGELEDSSEMQNDFTTSSYLWSSFMEQIESIGTRTTLLILATSEMPFEDLPSRISQFFSCETIKSGLSTSLKAAVPRFVVNLKGNLSSDVVLDISDKVSKNLAHYYIQLINMGACESSSVVKEIDNASVVKNFDAVPRSSDPISDLKPVGEHHTVLRNPVKGKSNLISDLKPVGKHHTVLRNPVKGKSNLILAISTFGYQILSNPHFSELCWVTSKLKEGPCTNKKGPCKGWPFNSCIARPVNSAERVIEACSSNVLKDKEQSYVLRGLVAVGLLAYKGGYTSLREVSMQVRKVLELLVGHINSKIQAGKNKYDYFRVLSLVASFEDLVTNWAYALRSLETDDPLLDGNPSLLCQSSPSSRITCRDGGIHEDDQCKQNIVHGTLHESEALEHKSHGIKSSKIGCQTLIVDLDLNIPIRANESASAVEKSSKPNATDHVASDVQLKSCLQKGSNAAPLEHGNGFKQTVSSVLLEDGPFSTGHKFDSALHGQRYEDSGFRSTACGIASENSSDDISRTCPTVDPGHASLYHCCSQCLVNLRNVILTLLKSQIDSLGSNVSVEGFHDLVAALSPKLQTAVQELVVTKSSSDLLHDKNADSKNRKHPRGEKCTCLSPEGFLMPRECHCHLTRTRITDPNSLKNDSRGLELTVSFKDGVVRNSEVSDLDACFRCKFWSLCLCSLVNWLATSNEL